MDQRSVSASRLHSPPAKIGKSKLRACDNHLLSMTSHELLSSPSSPRPSRQQLVH